MKYIKIAAFVFMAVFATAATTHAQAMKSMKGMKGMSGMSMSSKVKTTTIKGEVVDLACYLSKGLHGKSHEQCARACIRGGLPVGILTKSGEVYLAIGANHKPANSMLLPYAAKQVDVTGNVERRGGVDIVAVSSVKPVSAK